VQVVLFIVVVRCEDFPQCAHITGRRLATFTGKRVYSNITYQVIKYSV
jgi:hypothetical protein